MCRQTGAFFLQKHRRLITVYQLPVSDRTNGDDMGNAPAAPLVAVVNESAETVVMLRMALEDEGLETVGESLVDFGNDPTRLLSYFEEHDPALIVYDVAPPYAESWRAFKRVRDSESIRSRPVLLTTTDQQALADVVGPADAVEVLRKPFELDAFLRIVHSLLER